MAQTGSQLISVDDVYKWFPIKSGILGRTRGHLKAVDGVSLEVRRGETFGVVGESGCGKTTLARVILRLTNASKGSIHYSGQDITKLEGRNLMPFRRKMQMVFQDPYASLDPRQTVRSMLIESMKIHKLYSSKEEADKKAEHLVEVVGLNRDHLARFPHEFSGGQRQRIAVARALAVNAEFIMLDEPTSSLDVSVQAQILSLLQTLQKDFSLTYMFISHNLAVIRNFCNRTAVMYLGRVVEVAETSTLFERPLHPYTYALLSSVPIPDPEKTKEFGVLEGDVPSPIDIPPGCRFRPRCRYATDRCASEAPRLVEAEPGHLVECHYSIDFRAQERLSERRA
jgi:oligopeptide transport system ATP-binding protein